MEEYEGILENGLLRMTEFIYLENQTFISIHKILKPTLTTINKLQTLKLHPPHGVGITMYETLVVFKQHHLEIVALFKLSQVLESL